MSMNNFILKISVVVAIAMLPLLGISSNSIFYHASYSNSNLVISTDTLDGVVYSTVAYDNMYNDGAPGMPSLPVEYIRFSVPWNATNFTVSSLPRNWINNNLTHMLYPCQVPQMTDGSMPPEVTLPDSAAYFSGESYPSQMAWVAHEGFLDGENHIVTVALMPFSYLHSSTADVIRTARTLHVTLSYDLSDSLAMYPIVRNDSALREEGHRMAQSIVVNPNQVLTFSPTPNDSGIDTLIINPHATSGYDLNGHGAGDVGPVGPLQPQDSILNPNPEENYMGHCYPYLIVTTPDLKHSVRRIEALKTQKGYNVKVVTMDDVMNDPNAKFGDYVNGKIHSTDSAGVLRQYLRQQYTLYGTKYVLLVGNIPFRCVNGPWFNYLTDLYYSDLSEGWANTNSVDYLPELFVGRIMSKNEEQINNYTEKLFRYELNPGKGNRSYLRRAFYSEGREYPHILDNMKSSLGSFFPDTIVINDNSNNQYPAGKDIIDTLRSNPVGFICIYNHGDTTRTRVYGKDPSGIMKFIKSTSGSGGNGLNYLNNKYYPMVYYSPSCVTVPFDNKNKLTFGESFITGKDYGGPVYIGYTRSVQNVNGKKLTNAFARRLENGYYKPGVAMSLSKVDVGVSAYPDLFILGCFGDPEMDLWTNEPGQYEGVSIDRTDHTISISGLYADSTIVSYKTNSGNMILKKVRTSSVVLADASPESPIMLYNHNCIPYLVPMELQNVAIQTSMYVIANDVEAGETINNNRVSGEVCVKNGTEFELEVSGTVTLHDGFKVEKGATFAVYPACF